MHGMRALVLAVGLLLIGVAAAGAPANIDTDGFVQDGKTTYCEGVSDAKGPLVFEQLVPSSAGKCPITLSLSSSIRKNAATGTFEVWVNWTASLAAISVTSSLFPRVIDDATGGPRDVIASLLRACKAGSNCARDADVVVPAALDGDATSTGPFDDQGTKPLRSYVFGFAGAVDHVLVGKVVLPGDPKLNISATEFVAFQRVRSGAAATTPTTSPIVGTVHPPTNETIAAAKPDLLVGAANSANTTESDVKAASPTRGSMTNVIVLSAIVVVGVAIAVAYFVTVKKEKTNNHNGGDVPPAVMENGQASVPNASMYRLTDAAKQAPSVQFPTQPGQAQPPHPRYHQQQKSKPWRSPAPAAPQPRAFVYGNLTVSSNTEGHRSSEASSDMLSSQLTIDPRDGLLESQLTSFNSLHDSAVTLPAAARQTNRHTARHQRASSTSSYGEHVAADGDSQRLFTEVHLNTLLDNHRVTTVTAVDHRGTQHSTYSWVDSDGRASEDLEDELVTPIHERYPPRRR